MRTGFHIIGGNGRDRREWNGTGGTEGSWFERNGVGENLMNEFELYNGR